LAGKYVVHQEDDDWEGGEQLLLLLFFRKEQLCVFEEERACFQGSGHVDEKPQAQAVVGRAG
jgi:hypothetical protein